MGEAKLRFGALTLNDIFVYIVDPVDAQVIDISQGGMAIHTVVPLHMGEQYRFKISASNSSVSLDGEVVRCKLLELSEDLDGSHYPLYVNGVRFLIKRNPIEIGLLEIMHTNIRGERRADPRLKPRTQMAVEIAHPLACKILGLNEAGILFHSLEVPEMEEERDLLLQFAYESLILPTRMIHISNKEDEPGYTTRLEFLRLEKRERELIEALVNSLTTSPSSS